MDLSKIKFKEHFCQLDDGAPMKIDEKYVNIYVKIMDKCQANCPFCVYHNIEPDFKFYFKGFEDVLKAFKKQKIRVNKISFTGGEPTANIKLLSRCLRLVKKHDKKIFTVVNTNGYRLRELSKEGKLIDSIALSRHHFSEDLNFRIFDSCFIPSADLIREVQQKTDNIHLSCNLIKGYIDRKHEVLAYLNFASEVGAYDVGFVSLMPVTQFAEKRFIDFDKIDLSSENVVRNMDWKLGDSCKCSNYLFMPKRGNRLVKFYARHRCNQSTISPSNLVYDGKNLRDNFNGNIIY